VRIPKKRACDFNHLDPHDGTDPIPIAAFATASFQQDTCNNTANLMQKADLQKYRFLIGFHSN
jgi:hypothetical protein